MTCFFPPNVTELIYSYALATELDCLQILLKHNKKLKLRTTHELIVTFQNANLRGRKAQNKIIVWISSKHKRGKLGPYYQFSFANLIQFLNAKYGPLNGLFAEFITEYDAIDGRRQLSNAVLKTKRKLFHLLDVSDKPTIGHGGTKTAVLFATDMVVMIPNSVDGASFLFYWSRIVNEEIQMSQILSRLKVPC